MVHSSTGDIRTGSTQNRGKIGLQGGTVKKGPFALHSSRSDSMTDVRHRVLSREIGTLSPEQPSAALLRSREGRASSTSSADRRRGAATRPPQHHEAQRSSCIAADVGMIVMPTGRSGGWDNLPITARPASRTGR
jgi:hypothetical protein